LPTFASPHDLRLESEPEVRTSRSQRIDPRAEVLDVVEPARHLDLQASVLERPTIAGDAGDHGIRQPEHGVGTQPDENRPSRIQPCFLAGRTKMSRAGRSVSAVFAVNFDPSPGLVE
jgi:hypothetical protein